MTNVKIEKKWSISIENMFIWLIMLIPLVRYYDLIGTEIAMENIMSFIALLCVGILYRSNINKDCIELHKSQFWFRIFAAWAIIITMGYELFSTISVSNHASMHSINSYIVMFINILLIVFILRGSIKYIDCIRIYEKIITFLICIYALQWMLYIAGIDVSFKLPCFDFSSPWSHLRNITFGMSPSPRALFSEKSHLAQYMAPYIALCLYSDCMIKRHRFAKAILVSFVILSTVSGNGIILVAAEWLLYFTVFGEIKNNGTKTLVSILGIFLLIIVYYVLSNIETYFSTFSIMFSTDSPYSSSKADYRIYRGLDYFIQMPISNKISGVGNDHMYLFSLQHGLYSQYDSSRQAFEYFSAWFEVSLYYGLIGLVLCIRHLIELFKSSSNATKGLIAVMALLWMSTEMIFTNYHLMYILIIVATVLYKRNEFSECEV